MPTPTYDLIASNVLGSASASVTFSSISASYRDLIVVANWGTTSATRIMMRLNGDTGNNYLGVRMRGYGSGSDSDTFTYDAILPSGSSNSPTTIEANTIFQLMDYSATDKHTTVLVRDNLPASQTVAVAARWANTAAVNSVTVLTLSSTFLAGSTFYLFGIAS